jgi:phage terminase Nu1 subunit (DNA packaging protein)
MTKDTIGVDVETVSRVCNITPRRVQYYSNQPGFPARYPDGSYDLPGFSLAYIRSMQTELARRGDSPEPAELRAARLHLLRAQAEKVRLYNDIRSGKLVPVVDVSNALTRRLINCRDRLRSIPSSIGVQLTNKSEAYIVERLQEAFKLALAELDCNDWAKAQ